MTSYEKIIRELLQYSGCSFVKAGMGDYDIWYSPVVAKHFSVDRSILSRRHANTVLRLAGTTHQV